MDEKQCKRKRMEVMKKDAAASSSALDCDMVWESSISTSSANKDSEDDFRHQLNLYAIDLLRRTNSPRS